MTRRMGAHTNISRRQVDHSDTRGTGSQEVGRARDTSAPPV